MGDLSNFGRSMESQTVGVDQVSSIISKALEGGNFDSSKVAGPLSKVGLALNMAEVSTNNGDKFFVVKKGSSEICKIFVKESGEYSMFTQQEGNKEEVDGLLTEMKGQEFDKPEIEKTLFQKGYMLSKTPITELQMQLGSINEAYTVTFNGVPVCEILVKKGNSFYVSLLPTNQ